VTEPRADTIEKGREAWKSIRDDAHFGDWIKIGRALDIGRTEAMREAHANEPVGRGYNTAFSAWLDREGFGNMDKATRSNLASVMEHLAEINAWRTTIGDKRHKLNHPGAVWRSWQKSTKVPDPNRTQEPSPNAKIRESLAAAEERAHELEKQIADGGSNFNRNDTAQDQAAFLARELLTSNKVLNLINALHKEVKRMKTFEKTKQGEVKLYTRGRGEEAPATVLVRSFFAPIGVEFSSGAARSGVSRGGFLRDWPCRNVQVCCASPERFRRDQACLDQFQRPGARGAEESHPM